MWVHVQQHQVIAAGFEEILARVVGVNLFIFWPVKQRAAQIYRVVLF